MSSIKLFKKEINNSIGGFIEEVYAWELNCLLYTSDAADE